MLKCWFCLWRDVDERQIQIICSNVTDWLLKANDNSFMILSPVKGIWKMLMMLLHIWT